MAALDFASFQSRFNSASREAEFSPAPIPAFDGIELAYDLYRGGGNSHDVLIFYHGAERIAARAISISRRRLRKPFRCVFAFPICADTADRAGRAATLLPQRPLGLMLTR